MLFFCAVPPTLPIDPEGVSTFAAAGPYYVAQHVLGRRLVLERNRFYRGKRPQHVQRFVVDFAANPDDVLDKIVQDGFGLGALGLVWLLVAWLPKRRDLA